MPKVYPDISVDRFNVAYVPRLILSSDIFRPVVTDSQGGRLIRTTEGAFGDVFLPGDVFNKNNGLDSLRLPSDEEYIVIENDHSNDHVNKFIPGLDPVTLTHFTGYQIDVYRNNVPMVNLAEDESGFSWDIFTGKFYPVIQKVAGELFTFQAKWVIPDPVEYDVQVVGTENINNIVVDNQIAFLTTFVNTRIRVFRNNILQSARTDFTWDSRLARLSLNQKPILEETFLIKAY